MAVIVLSGADFSENNIGKIDLFNGFSSTTKNLFSAFGIVENESNMMQREVDKFVRALVDANIWGNDKINALCLPFLTNLSPNPNIDDAVLNCINTNQTFFGSSYSTVLELKNNGLVTKRTGEDRVAMQGGTNSWAMRRDVHIATFSLEDEPIEYTSSEQTMVADKFIYSGGPFIGLRTDCVFNPSAGVNVTGDQNYKNKACMMIVDYNPNYNSSKVAFYVNGQSVLSNALTTTDEKVSNFPFGKYSNPYLSANNYPIDTNPSSAASNGQVKAPYGLFSIGKYLTPAEVEVYNAAATNLIAAVHTYMDN